MQIQVAGLQYFFVLSIFIGYVLSSYQICEFQTDKFETIICKLTEASIGNYYSSDSIIERFIYKQDSTDSIVIYAPRKTCNCGLKRLINSLKTNGYKTTTPDCDVSKIKKCETKRIDCNSCSEYVYEKAPIMTTPSTTPYAEENLFVSHTDLISKICLYSYNTTKKCEPKDFVGSFMFSEDNIHLNISFKTKLRIHRILIKCDSLDVPSLRNKIIENISFNLEINTGQPENFQMKSCVSNQSSIELKGIESVSFHLKMKVKTVDTPFELLIWIVDPSTTPHQQSLSPRFAKPAMFDSECSNRVTCDPGGSCLTEVFLFEGRWGLQKKCSSKRCPTPSDCRSLFSDNAMCTFCCEEDNCNANTPYKEFTSSHSYLITLNWEHLEYQENMSDQTSKIFNDINNEVLKPFHENLSGKYLYTASLNKITRLPQKTDDLVNESTAGGCQIEIAFSWQWARNYPHDSISPLLRSILDSIYTTKFSIKRIYTCPEEYDVSDKGILVWPSVTYIPIVKNETVDRTTELSIVCSNSLESILAIPKASKVCHHNSTYGSFWTPVNLTQCTEVASETTSLLLNIAKQKMTKDNIIKNMHTLKNITDSIIYFNGNDIDMTIYIINGAIQFLSNNPKLTSIGTSVSPFIVDIFDNMLGIDSNVLNLHRNGAQITERFLERRDQFLLYLRQTYDSYTIVRPNIVFGVISITRSEPLYESIGIRLDNDKLNNLTISTNAKGLSCTTSLTTCINIPTGGDISAKKIDFSILKGGVTYFLTSSNNETQLINSLVIAIRFDIGHVSNLSRTIQMTLMPLNATYFNSGWYKLDNVCVYWNPADRVWSRDGCLFAGSDENGSIMCSCNHLTNFAYLMDIYEIKKTIVQERFDSLFTVVSYMGSTLSVVGLMITVLTYGGFKKLRKDPPGKILMCLSITLLGANIVFLAGSGYTSGGIPCKMIAILLHYLYLSVMCWSAVESFYLYRSCVQVFTTHVSRLLLKMSIFAWGMPMITVAITLATNTDNYEQRQLCWLVQIPFYIAFMTPVFVVLVFNFVVFVLVLRQLCRSRPLSIHSTPRPSNTPSTVTGRSQSVASGSIQMASTYSHLWSRARGALGLCVILGLTWMLALLAIKDTAALVFQLLFAAFNSAQGFFVFLFYCLMKPDVRIAWNILISRKRNQNSWHSNVHSSSAGNGTKCHEKKISFPDENIYDSVDESYTTYL